MDYYLRKKDELSFSVNGLALLAARLDETVVFFVFLAAMIACFACHKVMTYLILYPLFRLVFGTLYPAYASYKAVKTKNVKEHVKWMMYWIVFALFTCVETITDVLFSWFPFYYEIKIIIVIWLLSPATKGSSILYRKFVHPTLVSKEQEIDDYISKAKERSYKQVLDLGSKGVNVLMQTAIKGGGGLVNQLRRSYSLSDLSGSPDDDAVVVKDETDTRVMKKKRASPSRHSSESSSLYFSEVDVRKNVIISQVKSTDDISSGYSSGEVFGTVKMREGLVRSSSLSSPRPRSMRITRSTTAPKKTNTITEGEDELFECNVEEKSSSSSDGEFRDCMEDESVQSQDQKVPSLPSKDLQLIESTEFREISLYPQNSRLLEHMTVLGKDLKQEEKRAGKYKKRAAPQPPPSQKDLN
ncbi:receptor expression-enhancing protein 4 isoform X2 [Agrilus planipennis]|uniref:Receptor expression-enhancing protein 4 isoform X2 n=1 Tax=Agrilus planipennis TaxID=224129 RepID=A0A7F5RN62_AGRPL|nr:receptor expression-enhancing protein 4 isoform X2 [Agrilus planipennis]